VQERVQEKKREMQIRAREYEQIGMLQERIQKVNNSDMEDDVKKVMVESLTDRIKRIFDNRAERELMAAEREMQRQKELLEEGTQVRENLPEQNAVHSDPQEEEEARERETVISLTQIAVGKDKLNVLRQTRAALSRSSVQIRQAMESENSNYVMRGTGPDGVLLAESIQDGYGDPTDYRNQQLNKLTTGIARTNAAVLHTVTGIYNEAAKLQESQLPKYRRQHEDDEDADERAVIDIEI